MINISVERGTYEEVNGKKKWQKDSEGIHFLISHGDNQFEIISIFDSEKLQKFMLDMTKQTADLTIEELFVHANDKGFNHYYNLINENKESELNSWKDDEEYEDMKTGILADYEDYKTFFTKLLIEKEEVAALDHLISLDTRPREYILMWLKDEHRITIG